MRAFYTRTMLAMQGQGWVCLRGATTATQIKNANRKRRAADKKKLAYEKALANGGQGRIPRIAKRKNERNQEES